MTIKKDSPSRVVNGKDSTITKERERGLKSLCGNAHNLAVLSLSLCGGKREGKTREKGTVLRRGGS